jgi:hypothetical protein
MQMTVQEIKQRIDQDEKRTLPVSNARPRNLEEHKAQLAGCVSSESTDGAIQVA